jgi:carboxylesterase type B
MLRNLILPVIAPAFALFGSAGAINDTVRVEGGLISVSVVDEARIYKGIPFAAPPMGELRRKATRPLAAWEGVRNRDDFGPDCPQAPYPPSSLHSHVPPNPNSKYLGCLVNFPTTGDPNGGGLPKWTSYNFETKDCLDFGDTVQLRNH